MTNDLSVMRDRLRQETAALLGLDIDHLTPAQSIRLDRDATLRLELDDVESRKLVGAQFDAQKYIAISEALERLMGGTPEASAINHEHDFDGAFEELSQLLADRSDRIKAREQTISEQLRAEVAELKAENERLREQLRASPTAQTVEWVRDGTHCWFSEGFDPNETGGGWVKATKPSPPPAATAQSPQPPLPPPSSRPPANYLRRDDGFNVVGFDRWRNNG